MHPVGSYCTDVSRCTVNKTLFILCLSLTDGLVPQTLHDVSPVLQRQSMEIMTLYSQYIFSLILITVKNKKLFASNREIHKHITRNNTNLHLPAVNITKFYKGPYISGSIAFNHLTRHTKF